MNLDAIGGTTAGCKIGQGPSFFGVWPDDILAQAGRVSGIGQRQTLRLRQVRPSIIYDRLFLALTAGVRV